MKVINSINYNTPVKNVLYETLNNRNEVKKDSVLISKPEVNHEVVNVTISNVSVNTVTSEQLRRVGATVEMFLKRGVSTEALSERLRLNQDNIIERMAIHDELQVNEVREALVEMVLIEQKDIDLQLRNELALPQNINLADAPLFAVHQQIADVPQIVDIKSFSTPNEDQKEWNKDKAKEILENENFCWKKLLLDIEV